MKVLELFSGTECMSNAFRKRGHECFTVDWDEHFPSSLHIDILDLTADMILDRFGIPDVVWAACDCTTFSVAAIGFHRRKNKFSGNLDPKTEKARKADAVNMHTLELIRELNPNFFFIENRAEMVNRATKAHQEAARRAYRVSMTRFYVPLTLQSCASISCISASETLARAENIVISDTESKVRICLVNTKRS